MSENTPEKQEPTPSEIRATELLEAFAKRYAAAHYMQDADTFLSTNDIFNEVLSHCPDPGITEVTVYQLLVEMGYSYEVLEGSAKYVWLLKSRF